jgi:hypothetical protein
MKSIAMENEGKIDCLSFNPGWVPSNMTKDVINETTYGVVSSERSVSKALNSLGREWITAGAFRHELMHRMFPLLPFCLMNDNHIPY